MYNYFLDNKLIKHESYEKDLGITFNNSLNFAKHIRLTVAKANSRLGMIKRNFNNLSPQVFLPIYKALIRPLLEYGSCIWNPHLINEINEIEKVQRRATKLINNLKHLPYNERLQSLRLDSLKFRRRRYDILQVFRIIKGIDNISPNLFFEFHSGPNTRGHSFKLQKPRALKNIRLYSFSHRVIQDWNNLKQSTVDNVTLNSFKTALKKEWEHHPDKYFE